MAKRALKDAEPPEERTARGARIRRAYEAVGMTRQQVADTIGRYYHDVMRIEAGQWPSPKTLMKICDLSGMTERWILRGPQHSPEFQRWLANSAPADLHDLEREVLGNIVFPSSAHPGPDWYSVALGGWRVGTHGALQSGTQTRVRLAGETKK